MPSRSRYASKTWVPASAGTTGYGMWLVLEVNNRSSGPMEFFGIPHQALLSQLLLGLVNGSFYAMLSLGLAVIFGLLNVINFSHGALYMVGAFAAYIGVTSFGLNYWMMLLLAPLLVGLFGILIERSMLRWLYQLDHLYGL